MRIAGIIAEYVPFHRGHAWHVEETRRRSGCDYVVACVDGHFTQRGEPTPFSRWQRARMALRCGVDAVFELPTLFAVRTADVFAASGVAILGGIGADVLSFGCETEDMRLLRRLSEIRQKEPGSVSEAIQDSLAGGKSHARARGDAFADHLGLPREWINRPNLILGTEYLRAITDQGLPMEPLAIRRQGDYHGEQLGEFASATAIRAAFQRGETDAALACLPEAARPYGLPEALHPMDDLLLMALRRMTMEDMAQLPDMGEGLEHRLHRLCRETPGREALLTALKCKRYTHARLSRLLTHALLGFSRETLAAHPMPRYAKLIGIRQGAEPLLKELSSRSTLPIIADPVRLKGDPVFELECRATDIWSLLHDAPELRAAGRELRERFVSV